MDCVAVRQCGSVLQCGSVRQCEWQFMAVHTVVCGQCAAVRLVVYVYSMAVCAAVCGCLAVRQCAAARQCAAVREAVCGSSAHGSMRAMLARGSLREWCMWQCVAVRAAVRLSYLYTKSLTIYFTGIYALVQVAVGLSSIFLAY
jgi:hypothetical protein